MITNRMTETEIYNEVEKDQEEILKFLEKTVPKYRRTIIKSTKFPMYFTPVEYVSPRKNKYLLFFESRCKKDRDEKILFTSVCIYEKSGTCAITFFNGGITIYPSHFFSRYRSRFLKDDKMSTLDVIKRFFKINPTNCLCDFPGQDGFYGTCNEGAVLGKRIGNNIFVVKTFVSVDMLFDSQEVIKTEMHDGLIEYRKEIQ